MNTTSNIDFSSDLESPQLSEYDLKLLEAYNIGLLFFELFKELQKVKNPNKQAKITSLIEAFKEKPYKKRLFRESLEKTVKFWQRYEYDETDFDRMDLTDLHDLLRNQYVSERTPVEHAIKGVRDNIKILSMVISLVFKTEKALRKGETIEERCKIHADNFGKTYEGLTNMGCPVTIEFENCSVEDFINSPQIIFSTHQGGGMEDAFIYALFQIAAGNDPNFMPPAHSIFVKDSLLKLPVFGPLLNNVGATPIIRDAIINSKDGASDQIRNIADSARRLIDQGRGVWIFPEGTRSQDGNFASTKKRVEWAISVMKALRTVADEKNTGEYVVMCDTLIAHPNSIDKASKLFNEMPIPEAGITFKVFKLDPELEISDNSEDQFDTSTRIGFIRSKIKENMKRKLMAKKASRK